MVAVAEWNAGGNSGGSGIVVVRYQIGSVTATAKASGGAISFYGGKTIHTFTSPRVLLQLTEPLTCRHVECSNARWRWF